MNLHSVNHNFWHTLYPEDVLKKLETRFEGLTEAEAKERLEHFGPNSLPSRKPPNLGGIIFRQFKNPLIYVLLAAGLIALTVGEFTDAIFIFGILLLNAFIGTFQEWKAEQNAASLQSLLQVYAHVKRDGRENTVPADDLVPGDIVFFEPGYRVPADTVLLEAKGLMVDESLLTGESAEVGKALGVTKEDAPVSNRINMTFAGTTIVSGRGKGIVVSTGKNTQVGEIAETISGTPATKSPLTIRMEHFARQVSIVILGVILILGIVAIWHGMPFQEVIFFAIALAVSSIPEGLPIAVTVALSIASSRMAKRNVIVRQLTAVEALGSCTYIASDKTGTLTVNKQTIKSVRLPYDQNFKVEGEGYVGAGEVLHEDDTPIRADEYLAIRDLAFNALLTCEGYLYKENGEWHSNGDAVDLAVLTLSYKMDLIPEHVRQDTITQAMIPYESVNKFSAIFYNRDNRLVMTVKGAPETLLPLCDRVKRINEEETIDPGAIEKQAEDMVSDGYRVIAVAAGETDRVYGEKEIREGKMTSLCFLGLLGLIDPLRSEVKGAIQRAQQAGVIVSMVTGDHPLTALAISKNLGMASNMEAVVNGQELDQYEAPNNADFLEMIQEKRVFARVSPLHKFRIVEALQEAGHFVAVTGDGVNDVPALKKANIGVAMGSGTDFAKDTASIIITDDNFDTLESGIEEGRFAYDNIRKVTYLLISTGAAEVFLFVLSLFANLPLPLTAVQLLWLNLVTNGLQDKALAFEGGEPDAMKRNPRKPVEGIFNPLMIKQTVISGLTMGAISFGAWYWMVRQGMAEAEARNLLLFLMVLLQNVHVFNCRSESRSTFSVPLNRNYLLIAGVVAAQGIHILAAYLPGLKDILGLGPIAFNQWIILLLLALTVLLVMEVFKAIFRKTQKR